MALSLVKDDEACAGVVDLIEDAQAEGELLDFYLTLRSRLVNRGGQLDAELSALIGALHGRVPQPHS